MTEIPPAPANAPDLTKPEGPRKEKEPEKSEIFNALVIIDILFFDWVFNRTNSIKKNLEWCFGYNKNIGLLNLCVNDTKKLFLASSHIGIIYNFENNEQKLLEGHVSFERIFFVK